MIQERARKNFWAWHCTCGGCYLFESTEAIDAYIGGEIWKAANEMTPWHEVSIEKYDISE